MIYGNKCCFINEANMALKNDFNELKLDGINTSVYVYNGEGPIPHFHLINSKGEACIKITSAEQFNHNNKQKMLLNSKEAKDLNTWLCYKSGNNKNNNWKFILLKWNELNPMYKITGNIKMPDYSKL